MNAHARTTQSGITRARVGAWAWAVLCASIVSGCDQSVQQTCTLTCGHLNECGFLPSALGLGSGEEEGDCEQRCQLTSDAVRAPLTACSDDFEAKTGDRLWCDVGGCAELASCLLDTGAPAGVLGRANLRVELKLSGQQVSGAASTAMADLSENTCEDHETGDQSRSWEPGQGLAICQQLAATEVEFELQPMRPATGVARRVVVPCAQAFENGIEHDRVPSGIYRNSVRVRGVHTVELPAAESGPAQAPEPTATPSSTDEPVMGADAGVQLAPLSEQLEYCVVVQGKPRLIQANKTRTAVIDIPLGPEQALPDALACEEGPELCADGSDNDGNGLADCAETACSAHCERTTPALDEADAGADL